MSRRYFLVLWVCAAGCDLFLAPAKTDLAANSPFIGTWWWFVGFEDGRGKLAVVDRDKEGAVMVFRPDSLVYGSGAREFAGGTVGGNQFGGPYRIQGNRISMPCLPSTRVESVPPGTRFLLALMDAKEFNLSGDILRIGYGSQGASLYFRQGEEPVLGPVLSAEEWFDLAAYACRNVEHPF